MFDLFKKTITWVWITIVVLAFILSKFCPNVGVIVQTLFIGFVIMMIIRHIFIKGLSGFFWADGEEPDPQPFYGAAYQARNERRYGEAIALFMNVCKQFPNQATSYIILMDIYAKEYQDAEQMELVYQWGRNKIYDYAEMQKLRMAHINLSGFFRDKEQHQELENFTK